MKDWRKISGFTWQYLKKHRKIIYLFVLVYFLEQMIKMANTLLLGSAIDSMLMEKTEKSIILFSILFLVLNICSFIICYFAKVGGTKAMEVSRIEAKQQISRHVERTSIHYCGTMGSMAFMQRLNYDSAELAVFVINSSAQIPCQCVILILSLIVIFKIDVICGIAALIELPIIIGLYMAFQGALLERGRICAEKKEAGNKRLYELLADIRHIKKNQIYELLDVRYKKAAKQELDAVVKKTRMEYVYGIINNNMDMFLKVFLFFYGGFSVIKNELTVGEFTIIFSYFSLVTSACTFFLNFGKDIQNHKAYYERLNSIAEIPEETNGKVELEHIEEIELNHIRFGYTETDTILHDFSYRFKKGNLYAIAGGNGCGKSTMTTLLLGMYIDEHEGKITYNGYSIKELDMRTLRRKHIGVCEQEPYLIEDTIRYNMIYSNDKTDDEKLMQLAYHVSFDEFLKNTEQGLETWVGEGGNALSGGQKQKTALVKVFYKNPDVLVLDEPTSAMDVEGQERLIDYLGKIKENKIVIVITHDTRMMEAADQVVRM